VEDKCAKSASELDSNFCLPNFADSSCLKVPIESCDRFYLFCIERDDFIKFPVRPFGFNQHA